MRFKRDEYFDLRLVSLVAAGGHDVETVQGEGISGCQDQYLYNRCITEQRTLITLDTDFSNPFQFPPGPTAGIVVLRPPQAVLSLIRATLNSALPEIKTGAVAGNLWIVEPGRIRIYEPQIEES